MHILYQRRRTYSSSSYADTMSVCVFIDRTLNALENSRKKTREDRSKKLLVYRKYPVRRKVYKTHDLIWRQLWKQTLESLT